MAEVAANSLFRFSAKVRPGPGCEMPPHLRGAYVDCFVAFPEHLGALRLAVASWQALDVPYEVATAQLLLGLACRDAKDEAGCLGAFAAAEAAFAVLGAAVDLRRVHDLTTHGHTLPGGLTEREAEVLRLVADGKSNREVAAALFLSEKTVARHLSNMFTKLGVSSRVAATTFAYTHRIVERPVRPPLA